MDEQNKATTSSTPRYFLGGCMVVLAFAVSTIFAISQTNNGSQAFGFLTAMFLQVALITIPLLLIYTYATPWGRGASGAKLFNAGATITAFVLVCWSITAPAIKAWAEKEIARNKPAQVMTMDEFLAPSTPVGGTKPSQVMTLEEFRAPTAPVEPRPRQ